MRWISTEKLARASANRPWPVLAAWLALLVAGVLLTSRIGDVLTTDFAFTTPTDSTRADDLLEARLRGPATAQEQVLITADSGTVDDAAFRDAAETIIAELRALDGTVLSVFSYYESQEPSLISADRRTLLVPVTLAGDAGEAEHVVERAVLEHQHEHVAHARIARARTEVLQGQH